MNGLLDGVKVIDLSSVLAGPLASSFLAECGAEVLKVEPPQGDVTMTWRAQGEPFDRPSAYHCSANTGKKTVTVDLKSEEGRTWLRQQLMDADVLLHNMKDNDLAPMGLIPSSIAKSFPKLIHVRLVGSEFERDRLAYDVVIQAETGFMSMNGHPQQPPTKMPVAMMDILASHQLRAAVLGGLYERTQTGVGLHAEVSLLGSGLTALANQGTNALINGIEPGRMGSSHPNIAPYGDLLDCADGKVVLAVGSDRQFQDLCGVLSCSDLAMNPAFASNQDRLTNRSEMMERLNEKAILWKRTDLKHALHKNRVPCGVVCSVIEAIQQPGVLESYVVVENNLPRLRTSAVKITRWRSEG